MAFAPSPPTSAYVIYEWSLSKCTKHEEDCANFCVLLRMSELYLVISKPWGRLRQIFMAFSEKLNFNSSSSIVSNFKPEVGTYVHCIYIIHGAKINYWSLNVNIDCQYWLRTMRTKKLWRRNWILIVTENLMYDNTHLAKYVCICRIGVESWQQHSQFQLSSAIKGIMMKTKKIMT